MTEATETKPFIAGRFHSISSTWLWEQCPQAYKFQYVDRVPRQQQTVPIYMRRGSVVHRALEVAFVAAKDKKLDGPLMDCAEEAIEGLREAWVEYEMPKIGGELEDNIALLLDTLETLGPIKGSDVLGAEHKFLTSTIDGTNFIGYADLMMRTGPESLLIRDWKISSAVKSAEEITHSMQSNMYGWAAQEEWPWAERIYVSEYYPPVQTEVMVLMDPEAMADCLARFEADAEEIETATEYEARKGERCGGCEYASICPAIKMIPKEQLDF